MNDANSEPVVQQMELIAGSDAACRAVAVTTAPASLLALVLIACATGCGESRHSQSKLSVRIDGSSTVYPISEAAAEDFDDERRQAGKSMIRVPVALSGTGGGFKRFATGEIDICDASREIKPSEVEACRAAGIDYVAFSIAFDGIAIVVHPDCDWVDSLTVAQLKELWRPGSGVKRWSDLDPAWPDQPIRLFGPGTDSGTFDYFTSAIVGEARSCRNDFTPSEDDNVIVQGVAGDRYGLGYFGYAYYAENRDRLKLLAIDGGDGPVKPSHDTIRSGEYRPLSRPLFIYVNKASLRRREVAQFVDYYIDHASRLATEVGYVATDDATLEQDRRTLDQLLNENAESVSADGGGQPQPADPAADSSDQPRPTSTGSTEVGDLSHTM